MSTVNNRILRVNEDIGRELSVLLRDIKDPRIKRQGMISITSVDTTSDLRQAKVYISVLNLESEKDFLKGLKSASGYLRSELGKALDLRFTPELIFELDNSIEKGSRISSILSSLPDVTSPSTMLDHVQTADWLDERDNFLIITHRRPDGDTTGSAGALAQGLREYGKTAYILPNSETTPRYMRYVKEYHAPEHFIAENIITVDIASCDLFHKDAVKYKGDIALSIDHHDTNTGYAKFTCLNSSLSSCGELVFEILNELLEQISPRIAECLYVAVSTDTGCFAYANTTANSLQTASYLVEAGAPQKEINKSLFRTKSRSRLKIEGIIYSEIEFLHNGAAAIICITRDMMEKAQAEEDDVDDISALPIGIEGVKVGITLREIEPTGSGKGSVRTMPGICANEIAAKFGGGGHPMAAGFSFSKTIEEIKEQMIEVIAEIIEKQ